MPGVVLELWFLLKGGENLEIQVYIFWGVGKAICFDIPPLCSFESTL
jgi:hypothetical protein